MNSGINTSENGKKVKPDDDDAARGGGLLPPNCAGSGSAMDRIRTYVRRRWKRNEILAAGANAGKPDESEPDCTDRRSRILICERPTERAGPADTTGWRERIAMPQ